MSENLALEQAASHALFVARLLERALYEDDSRWTMQWGPFEVDATRTVTDTCICFEATFEDYCWLAEPESMLLLKVDGEIVGVRPFEFEDYARFTVGWELALGRSSLQVAV